MKFSDTFTAVWPRDTLSRPCPRLRHMPNSSLLVRPRPTVRPSNLPDFRYLVRGAHGGAKRGAGGRAFSYFSYYLYVFRNFRFVLFRTFCFVLLNTFAVLSSFSGFELCTEQAHHGPMALNACKNVPPRAAFCFVMRKASCS